jgi:hypothetical protein
MRWNCPHCSVALAVSDEKLGTGWSFSRCYQCGGHALVRRADVNLIKVDQAPPGERRLPPEATESPTVDLRAVTRAPARSTLATTADPGATPRAPEPAAPSALPLSAAAAETPAVVLPPPLPEPRRRTPTAPRRPPPRALHAAIAAAGVTAIVSSVYLYQQGQEMWRKARLPARPSLSAARPVASAPLAVVASAPEPPVSDQIHQRAMAPVRDEAPAPQNLVVQPRIRRAAVRTGPGLEYPIIGLAQPNARYLVSDWSDRWFKVVIENPSQALQQPASALIAGRGRITAWIRNDLVQLTSGDKP